MNADSSLRHSKLVALVALAALVACSGCAAESTAESEEGRTASAQQAITNGDDDDADPAVVALLIGGEIFCTGVLITSNVVATAAHCVKPGPPEQVYFGVEPSSKKGTFIAVSDSKAHPDFDEDTLTNDIAILVLARKAPVAPVAVLTTPFDDSFKGLPIRLVGFGVTGDGNEANLRKRSGTTTISSFGDDDFRFHATPSQTCNGDSGGPALAQIGDKEVVVGLASSGDSSCTSYGRHVRIDSNLAFVQSYAKAYARHQTLAPMPNSGCSMTARSSTSSSTAALVLAVGCVAAAGARRRRSVRSVTGSEASPSSRPAGPRPSSS